ncbi:hypothetical protein SK128_019762 [Halocaridina rubra]|uniref:G-protein coupled receptors family 1 profile domain-containing protein n=1 Tax=Halocaridina rubra TaxID=373956 RepID=A0AAN8WGZ0_HALRR
MKKTFIENLMESSTSDHSPPATYSHLQKDLSNTLTGSISSTSLVSHPDHPSSSHPFISSRNGGGYLEAEVTLFPGSFPMEATTYEEDAAWNSTFFGADSMNESLWVRPIPKEMVFNESHIITISTYSCLMVFSALGNIFVLKSIVGHRKRTSTSRVSLMIMHLTIADLLVTFLLMPLEIGWAWTVSWVAGDLACRVLAFFRTFGVYLSGFLLVVISIDRYHAVLRPLTVTEAKRRVRIMLWMAWGASVSFSAPQMIIFHVEKHPEFPWFEQCVTFNSFPSPTYELIYMAVGFVAMYALPLTTIVFCYGSIVIVLYKKDDYTSYKGTKIDVFVEYTSCRGTKRGLLADCTSCRGTKRVISRDQSTEQRHQSLGRAKTRTLHMTLIIVTVFFLCWTPYNIMSLWYFVDRKSAQMVDPRVQAALFIFAVANSTVNPLVYGYFNVRRGPKSQSVKHEWRMKKIVYKPPFRQHVRGCLCTPVRSSSSDLPCNNPYNPGGFPYRTERYIRNIQNHHSPAV